MRSSSPLRRRAHRFSGTEEGAGGAPAGEASEASSRPPEAPERGARKPHAERLIVVADDGRALAIARRRLERAEDLSPAQEALLARLGLSRAQVLADSAAAATAATAP
jgi:hypothetical protein